MGKGNRNRENNAQGRVAVAAKKKKRPTSEWLPSVIAVVVVVAILAGVLFSVLLDNGIFMRNRVLVKSKTGKFDVNQQMATYIAWQTEYNWAAQVYLYKAQYGYDIETEDENAKIKLSDYYTSGEEFDQSSYEQYAMSRAWEQVSKNLRDCVDENMDTILTYVAVADAAYEAGVRLDKTDKADFNETAENFLDIRDSLREAFYYYNYGIDISKDIKKRDIKNALELMTMYTKYGTMMQAEMEGDVTSSDRESYRDENPDSFYKIDYLTYNVKTEDEAKAILAGITDAESFKSLVIKNYLDNNYKTLYNQLTTQKTAADLLEELGDKTDTESGTALSDFLKDNQFDAEKMIQKDDAAENQKVRDWLFESKRKQFEKTTVATDDGIYVVVYLSEEAPGDETTEVKARYKYLPFAEGEAHGEDAAFKQNVLTYVTQSKQETPVYPEVSYQTAYAAANAFLTEWEGKSATDIKAAIEALEGFASAKNVTSSTSSVPQTVRDAATAEDLEKSKLYVVPVPEEGDEDYNKLATHYVYIVTDEEDGTLLTYAAIEGDLYYELINDLCEGLDAVYPEESKTASYKSEATAGSYEEWLSEVKEGGFVSVRTENEAKYFEKKGTKDGDPSTWDIYVVVKNEMATDSMLYLDTKVVVSGGYYLFNKEDYAAEAQKALETLGDKTEVELLSALTAINSAATTSTAFPEDESDVAEDQKMKAEVKEWLFSPDRTPNSVATFSNAEGNGTYVAVFIEKATAWEISAKSGFVSEKLDEWMKGLASEYSVREKTLAKLGEPTTEAATTAAA